MHPAQAMTSSPESEISTSPGTPERLHSPASPNFKTRAPPNSEPIHRRTQITRLHSTESPLQSPLPVSSSSATEHTSYAARPVMLLARNLLGIDNGSASDGLEDALSVATKRRGVYNLIQVPMRLERLITFGQLICLDEFLTLFTFLPLRVVLSFIRLFSSRTSRVARSTSTTAKYRTCCITWAVDTLHLTLLIIASLSLRFFDISWIYHNIRGQSVIKLYVVFNVIEIFDRLCSSFGVDILDSLGWTTASAVQFYTRQHTDTNSGAIRARTLQGLVLVSRVAFDYTFALVYVMLHATLLLTWVVTLNVAINTQNNALLTLLVSNNFVELKGAVFKSFKVQNLFQIACSDAVERFQLCIFLGVMLIVTNADEKLFTTFFVIVVCEVIVDWIKHAFVTKFNRISPDVYRQFVLVICDDIARSRSQSVVRSIGGSGISKRIGFVCLPLAALVTRMSIGPFLGLPKVGMLALWLSMVAIKTAVSISLIGHSWRRTRDSRSSFEDASEGDATWVQKLMQVERYDLISKNA